MCVVSMSELGTFKVFAHTVTDTLRENPVVVAAAADAEVNSLKFTAGFSKAHVILCACILNRSLGKCQIKTLINI